MSNPTGGLFQTLVAAASEAAANLTYQNALVDAIYWDLKGVVQTPNTTLNVIIPTVDESDVADIGSGSLQVTDTDHNSVAVPFNQHFSTSFKIPSWDQARTPVDLERKYLKPRLEALLRKVNHTISQQVTTANFGTSATPVPGFGKKTGATSGYFVRSDINLAWSPLALNGTPMDDGNLTFVTGPTAFGKMLTDQSLIYQYIVGNDAALAAQQKAKLAAIFGADIKWDQHFEMDAVSNGFTTGKAPSALLHKYAIAAVTAPPAPAEDPAVKEQIIMLKDVLPVQMQVGFSLKDQGTIVNLHCYWGVKVARPDFGCLLESA